MSSFLFKTFPITIVLVFLCFLINTFAFRISHGVRFHSSRKVTSLRMGYIPDGLTKEQWEAIQKKEQEDAKAKGNLGVVGVNRFKSRSFEAWQKAGARHLFPTNPVKTPFQERPYMQRRGGDWEGKDLKKVGLEGTGQGTPSPRLKVDDYYEVQRREGKLNSVSIFGGLPLPWTSDQAKKLNNQRANDIGAQKAVAGKKLTPEEERRLKANLFKPIVKESTTNKPDEPPKKKFGWF